MADFRIASAVVMDEPQIEYIRDCINLMMPPSQVEVGTKRVLYLVGDVRQQPEVVFVNGRRYEASHA